MLERTNVHLKRKVRGDAKNAGLKRKILGGRRFSRNGGLFVGAAGRMDLADAPDALDPLAMLRAQRRQAQPKEFFWACFRGACNLSGPEHSPTGLCTPT